VEFIPCAWDDIAAVLEKGAADIGFGCFSRGGGRNMLETTGYYARRPFVLTRRGEFFPSEAAMENRTVLCDEAYPYSFARTTDVKTGVSSLLDKTADAVICDEFAAISAVKAGGEAVSAELMQNAAETVLVGLVARQNRELHTAINCELETIMSEGKIAEIAAQYI
jgi:ABC-type amino acid transport substrate-binding protein